MWVATIDRDCYLSRVKGHQPVSYARNVAAQAFMAAEKSDWLMMIDNDVAPIMGEGAFPLLSILDDSEGWDIIVPATYMWQSDKESFAIQAGFKQDKPFYMTTIVPDEKMYEQKKVAIDVAGFPCVFIHRRVFEKMPQPWFRYVVDPESQAWGPTEDIDFTWRATQEHGLKMCIDLHYACDHFHTFGIMSVHATWTMIMEKQRKHFINSVNEQLGPERGAKINHDLLKRLAQERGKR
jgi:hypothetical protein